MSLRQTLSVQLAHCDDEALVALANRGLLRRARKDLESQSAELLEDDDSALVVGFAGQRIRFASGVLAQAQCSCPASGVCQHIIAAILSLPALLGETASSEADTHTAGPAESIDAEAARTALYAELLAIEPEALRRHAGTAGYRWAHQFVLDLDGDGIVCGGERHPLISCAHPRFALRYLGGGLDGLIADSGQPQPKHVIAAVLACWQAHGQALPAPPAARTGSRSSSDEPPARATLREQVRRLCAECVELGLTHLSPGIHERCATLAVGAQGCGYPRLARLLRRLADQVEALLERSAGADTQRLCDELALAYALAAALDAAAAEGRTPVHLAGRSREGYAEGGRLELLGLGAWPWRAASGYVGLTLLFWDLQAGEFLSCTDARPQSLHGFDPRARHGQPGPWHGLGSPAQAAGRRLALANAALSASGRLSAADSVHATLLADDGQFFETLAAVAVDDWAQLAERQAPRSLLAGDSPLQDWLVLRPAQFGAAEFDSARQTLSWPLLDASGRTLLAEIAYDACTAHAIGRIEALATQPPPAGTLLIAQLRRTAAGLLAAPLSLLRADAAPLLDELHFSGQSSRRSAAPAETVDRVAEDPEAGLPALLREIRELLLGRAERGLAAESAPPGAWPSLCSRARDEGLDAFLRLAETGRAEQMLRAQFLCMQYARLLG